MSTRDLIDALDAFISSAQRLRTAILADDRQLVLPLDGDRAGVMEAMRPRRRKKHARYGLVKLGKVRRRFALDCSVRELEKACDRLGLFHQEFAGETYIHYWNAETLRRYYADGN